MKIGSYLGSMIRIKVSIDGVYIIGLVISE